MRPLPAVLGAIPPAVVRAAGGILVATVVGYIALPVMRRRPFRIRSLTLPVPPLGLTAAQVALSAVEWSLAGAVLYVLLPPGSVDFVQFVGAFVAATLLGLVSHVPGGVGVFEGLMVLLLKPQVSSSTLLPALVTYRAIYYVLPLTAALLGLIADETWQRRRHVARAGAVLGQLAESLTPRILSVFTFASGLVLLFSGATPAAAGRLEILHRLLPLGVIEASHFLGSIAGDVLLILSQGLARRLDAAFYLAASGLAVGVLASLFKGLDYEEAAVVLAVLVLLVRARPAFDRRAAFFDTRFSAGWIAAVAGALGASIWLGLFAFKHVNYSDELWWQFELRGEASRFLRASVGAAIVLLLFGVARLLRHAPHLAPHPGDADLDDAARAIGHQTSTSAYLVFLRDKSLLFDAERRAFIMYGVQGRTWVALGDPVGPEEKTPELIRLFLERCDDFGGIPAFYQIGRARLHHYADFGLTFVKIGEEARVDLARFTLEGAGASRLRQSYRRLQKDGATFRVLSTAEVAAAIGELRAVSDEWLRARATAEKGFSLGFFDEGYIRRFPVAVVERAGRIEAFANLWAGPEKVEASVDLMRHRHDAPKGVMETLFVHLIKWAQDEGYSWFALGMAPLSGFESSPAASMWNRLGAFLYEHADAIYNFQGLRAFKEKFDPVWEPRYVAYPGGLRLPRIMADVSALVAGGYRRIFTK
jgi:phosphatidylglycerol lysyltransferase